MRLSAPGRANRSRPCPSFVGSSGDAATAFYDKDIASGLLQCNIKSLPCWRLSGTLRVRFIEANHNR